MKPIILATWSFGQRANAAGWPILERGGGALDAVEAACRAIELDPLVDSVGVGGIPDRSGRLSLDGCVMLAPDKCGSVAAVRRFAHPVSIARRVMERTPHVMLVGDGADAFAEEQGFTPAELLTDAAKAKWTKLMTDKRAREMTANREERGLGSGVWGLGGVDSRTGRASDQTPNPRPQTPPSDTHRDTVGVLALDSSGVLAGACSTSGWPCKLPGRVGDSPIIGHGLYVDPRAGAAVATGHGERVMGVCGSFLTVEWLRRGARPLEAIVETLSRIRDNYALDEEDQVGMIALTPEGEWACAALRAGYRTAVRTQERDEVVESEVIVLR